MSDTSLLLILLPSFAGGVLVLSTHLVLGRQVLKRGIVFMDLAMAQIAAMGTVIAHMSSASLSGLCHSATTVFQTKVETLLPFLFSIAGACLISQLTHRAHKELEAMIGCVYVLAATGTLLLVASDPHGAEHITSTLEGRIIWIQWSDLIMPSVVSLILIAGLMFKPSLLNGKAFYPVFAVLVTLSVSLVGVYMVFSTLIMPALAISGIEGKKAWMTGFGLGVLGIAAGLMLSCAYDLPGGASIVVVLAAVCASYRLLVVKYPAVALQ